MKKGVFLPCMCILLMESYWLTSWSETKNNNQEVSVMKKRIVIIIGNDFVSLFFIGYFLSLPIFSLFAFFLRRISSHYDIVLAGNSRFVDYQSIDVPDEGRAVVPPRGANTNDALFICTGPAFRRNDIPDTVFHPVRERPAGGHHLLLSIVLLTRQPYRLCFAQARSPQGYVRAAVKRFAYL